MASPTPSPDAGSSKGDFFSQCQLEPANLLSFEKLDSGEYTQPTIRIRNLSKDLALLYRVQTTSPQTYRVRPSHGRIVPAGTGDIGVVSVADPNKNDKFLIRIAQIKPDIPGDFTQMMASVEPLVKEHKLRCVVEGAMAQSSSSIASPAAGIVSTASPFGSAEKTGVGADEDRASGVPASSTPVSVSKLNSDAMVAELKESRLKIQQLSAKNQELVQKLAAAPDKAGLRQRGPGLAGQSALDSDAHDTDAAYEPTGIPADLMALLNSPNGFPPVLVLLIALFAFLVGLLF